MTDILIALILILILAGAGMYVYKARKSGQKCVGCPHSKECSSNCSCSAKK